MNYAIAQSQGSLEAVANMMCPAVGLSVVVSDVADTGATDGRTIVLPTSALNTPKNRGFLDHEVGHALFTDMREFRAYSRRSAWHKDTYNMVEDMRIEAKVRDMFPGAHANLAVLSEELERDAVKQGVCASYKNREELLVAGTQQWLYARTQEREYGTYGKFRADIERKIRSLPDGGEILRELEVLSGRICAAAAQGDVARICDDYHELVKNWVRFEPEPPRPRKSKDQSGNEPKGQSGNGPKDRPGNEPKGQSGNGPKDRPGNELKGQSVPKRETRSEGAAEATLDGYSAAPDKGKEAKDSLDRAKATTTENDFRSELMMSRNMFKNQRERCTDTPIDAYDRAVVRGTVGPVLQSVLQTQTIAPVTTGYSGRRLEGRRLSRVAVGDGRIFSTRTVTRRADTEVIFLLDLSGSMIGSVGDYAAVMFGMADAVRNLRGFTVKTYGYATEYLAPLEGIYEPQAGRCTPTAAAAFYASRKFSDRRSRRVLIILTDGGPDSHPAWVKVSADIRREGIEVYAIGLGFDPQRPELIPEMLKEPTSVVVPDHTALPAALRDLFTRNLIVQ